MNHLNLILVLAIVTGILLTLSTFQVSTTKEKIKLASLPANSTPLPTASISVTQPNQTSGYQQFLYPNAAPANSDQTTFISFDDSSIITNWYKEKIKSLGMNTTSFIQTNTNGFIINKLVAKNDQKEVSVEISKKSNQKEVSIFLNVNQ